MRPGCGGLHFEGWSQLPGKIRTSDSFHLRNAFNTKDVENHEECTKFFSMKRRADATEFARARRLASDTSLPARVIGGTARRRCFTVMARLDRAMTVEGGCRKSFTRLPCASCILHAFFTSFVLNF